MHISSSILLRLAVAVALVAAPWPAAPARAQAPTVITVNTTTEAIDFGGLQQVSDLPGPDGLVTWPEAIFAANNTTGPQTIAFNIPLEDPGYQAGLGVFMIMLEQGTFLALNDDGTTIDGTTQAAFTGDTNPSGPEVHIRTTPPFANLPGLKINSDNNTIVGMLGFAMFRYGLDIAGDNNVVRGCNFVQSNSASIYISGSNNRIGGALPEDANLIQSSGGNGVWIVGAGANGNVVQGNTIVGHHSHGVKAEGAAGTIVAGNVINSCGHTSSSRTPVGANVSLGGTNGLLQGNMIGVDATGTVDEGNIADGVTVLGSGHTIEDNVISGHNYAGSQIAHWGVGLEIAASDVVVRHNFIGTDPTGTFPLPNVIGVRASGSNVRIGGAEPGDANTIALNMRDGVALPSPLPTGVRISRNAIYGNGELGINVGFAPLYEAYPSSVTLANAPILDSAVADGGTTIVTGHLTAANPQTFTVELFSSGGADPSGYGEGQTFEAAVTPGTSGQFLVAIPRSLASRWITATATAADGSTSEFSDAESVTGGIAPALTVVFPHAGDTWAAGSTRDVRWNTSGTVDRVAIRVSYDGGAHFETLAADVANTGTFSWAVAGRETIAAQVSIAKVSDPSVRDASDAFRITTGPLAHAATPGVYLSSGSSFFLRDSASPGPASAVFNYGPVGAGWTAITGDWDADGIETVGLYDPSTSTFFLRNANTAGPAAEVYSFGPGGLGWVPLAGDWDGDGDDTVGLYDPATGNFYLRNAHAPGGADAVFSFGAGGAVPIAGDWNGDGTDTIGLYLAASGTFFLRDANAPGPADLFFSYGPAGAVPVVGDWDGNGTHTVGVYMPSTGSWFLRNANSAGAANVIFNYGPAGATPLAGDWDGL